MRNPLRCSITAVSASVLILLLASCSKKTPPPKKIVIIQTTDIHSHFNGSKNWIILAANIAEARKKAGGTDKTLLIDTGDTLQGTIQGTFSQGEMGLSMLNASGYDAWVLGNHDYDFGAARLAELINQADSDVFAANLAWESEANHLKSWRIYKKNGLRIALIGLTSPYLRKWFWGGKLKGITVLSAMKTLEKIMPEVLRAKPDFTILAIHHGPYTPRRLECPEALNVKTIAKKYPQINLILGGHTHQSIPGQEFGNDTWFVEPGCHAEQYAWIEVTFPADGRRPVIRSKLVTPHRVSKKLYAKFAAPVLTLLRKSWRFSRGTPARLNHALKPERRLSATPGSLERLFCESIARSAGTKAAITGCVNEYAELSGKVTEWNLFNIEPFEDTVCVLRLNRREFLEIVNEQIKQWRLERPQAVFGIEVEGGWRANAPYPFDTLLRYPDGRRWGSERKRVKVAFSSYALAGAGGRFPKLAEIANRPECRGKDTGKTIRDAMREFLKESFPISQNSPPLSGVSVVNNP
jgi:2',3'-cyclic-nucleotide 2'-phosphodiesterase (5'-nucleotidase family)